MTLDQGVENETPALDGAVGREKDIRPYPAIDYQLPLHSTSDYSLSPLVRFLTLKSDHSSL